MRRCRGSPEGEAPVAQLDRAPDYESGGREFESLRARQLNQLLKSLYIIDICPEIVAGQTMGRCETIRLLVCGIPLFAKRNFQIRPAGAADAASALGSFERAF